MGEALMERGERKGSPWSWGAVVFGGLGCLTWLLWAWFVWGRLGYMLRRSGEVGEILETLSVLGPLGFTVVAMPLAVLAGRRKEPRENLGNAGAMLAAVCALMEVLHYFALVGFAPR